MTAFRNPIIFILFIGCFIHAATAKAQLWRYLNMDTAGVKIPKSKTSTDRTLTDKDGIPYKVITYNLKSLDGKGCQVSLVQVPFTGVLTIISLHDSLQVADTYGIQATPKVINGNLLQVVYAPRIGSDEGGDNTVLIGVKNGKLHLAAQIQTYHEYQGLAVHKNKFLCVNEHYLSHSRLFYKHLYDKSLQVIVNNYEAYSFIGKHRKNYTHRHRFVLRFDKKEGIFYNTTQFFKGNFEFYAWRNQRLKSTKQQIDSTYPEINLGASKYYYIKGAWYEENKDRRGEITFIALL